MSAPLGEPAPPKRRRALRLRLQVTAVSWWDLAQTLGPALIISALAILVALHFVRPAPPHVVTISSGPAGSNFESVAKRYQKIFARNAIELRIQTSEGSLDNLNRLTDTTTGVDVGMVQTGVTGSGDTSDLVSLGSVFYQPVTIFYRSPKVMQRLSELRGGSIAIGHPFAATGTRIVATLAKLLAEDRAAKRGLVSVCTAGGMGVTAIIER